MPNNGEKSMFFLVMVFLSLSYIKTCFLLGIHLTIKIEESELSKII
jgi:hypothetical protein